MFDALLGTMQKDFQLAFEPQSHDRIYGPLETSDNYIFMMVISPRHFEDLADIIGQPELKTDDRFATTVARLHNYAELVAIIASWVRTRTTAEVLAQFTQHKIPASSYRDITETLDDPQLRHRNMITEINDDGGPLSVPNSPFLFSQTHAAIKPQVASIGAHNQAVLQDELGLHPDTLTAL